MYPAMAGAKIPSDQWTIYETKGITGESFGVNHMKFRPETKYVRVGFLHAD